MRVLTLLCLTLFSGCSLFQPAPPPVELTCSVPDALLVSQPEPVLEGKRWGDLAAYARREQAWGRACEADRVKIREAAQKKP